MPRQSDYDPVTLGSDDGQDVGVVRGIDGSMVLLPRSYLKASEEQREVISEVQQLAATIQRAQAQLRALVPEARSVGCSWGLIGWSLGITAQSAGQRFGDL